MGKNQAYKAMQRAKMSTNSANGGVDELEDGMMDGSFHSPEWHAARLASLHTSHTITWEDYKKGQKEEARRREEQEDDEARLMRDYRAQLDAERASKLARGVNHVEKKVASKGRKGKDRKRKRSDRKRGRMSESELDSELSSDVDKRCLLRKERWRSRKEKEPDSELSSDDHKRGLLRKERRRCRKEKERKIKSKRRWSKPSSDETSREDKEYGPIPLSSYFDNVKS